MTKAQAKTTTNDVSAEKFWAGAIAPHRRGRTLGRQPGRRRAPSRKPVRRPQE